MSNTLSSDDNWRFSYRVLLPIVFIVIITLATFGAFMIWTASRTDEASISRQIRLVSHIIEQQKTLIKKEQEDVAAWDKAVDAVQDPLDMEWIEENLGKGMREYFGHDRTFLLDPELKAVYAMKDGKSVEPELFEKSREELEPITKRLREINWQGAFDAYTYGHTPYVPNIVEVTIVEGKPAIVSQMPIISNKSVRGQIAGKEYIHISVEFLDDELALEFYETLLLKGGYFSTSLNVPKGETSIAIKNLDGQVITNFLFQPDHPGADMFAEIAPALIGVALFASIVIAMLVLRLHQTTKNLEREREEAQHLAYHDALTGLGNRAKFEVSLLHSIENIKNNNDKVALLILDLDRFKLVNDTLGHQAGDELIREVAARLQPLVRSSDIITRLGGDEFAIIINSVISTSDVEAVCARMVGAIHEPFNLQAGQAFVGVSIGVSIATNANISGEEITRQADIALYEAKENGKNQFVIFEDRMNEEVQYKQLIESELRKALIDKNQLQVKFEHLVRKNGSEIIGVEAKLVWNHPTLGTIESETFLSIAETSGLIEFLGEYLLSFACKAGAKTPSQIMAVRVFSAQLSNPNFKQTLFAIIDKTGINPNDLELEIDENTLTNACDKSIKNIKAFREAGIRIALGDFGTGFTSLRLLQEFQVDRIKISRSFIAQLAQSPDPEAITHAVVWLARAIGVEVTADGVECAEQKDFLARMGCMSFQGKLFSASSQHEWLQLVIKNAKNNSSNDSQIDDRIEVWGDTSATS